MGQFYVLQFVTIHIKIYTMRASSYEGKTPTLVTK